MLLRSANSQIHFSLGINSSRALLSPSNTSVTVSFLKACLAATPLSGASSRNSIFPPRQLSVALAPHPLMPLSAGEQLPTLLPDLQLSSDLFLVFFRLHLRPPLLLFIQPLVCGPILPDAASSLHVKTSPTLSVSILFAGDLPVDVIDL